MEILVICVLGLILLSAVVVVATVKQIRRFAAQVREDERRAAEEAVRCPEGVRENDESGAKV